MVFGKRFIHQVIDKRAVEDPRGIYLEYPKSADLKVWRSVDFSTLKRAVDRVSWWIDDILKNCEVHDGSRTFCYIGSSDIRYWLVAIAAEKTSSKVKKQSC